MLSGITCGFRTLGMVLTGSQVTHEQIGIFVSQKETQVVQVHCEQAKVVLRWSSALAEPFGSTGGTDEREA